jgi:hypothetical protein
MSISFPRAANDLRWVVGRTPWSARVPLDPLLGNEISCIQNPAKPTRASAAVQGDRPTKNTN